jgi:chromosome segregation ATPase
LAENPQINVEVIASVARLQEGLKEAEQSVAETTAVMAQEVEKLGLGERFKRAYGQAAAAGRNFQLAAGAGLSAVKLATGDVEGAINALPGAFGAAASAGFQLGSALNEAITGAKAAAEGLAKEVEQLDRRGSFKAATRDLERQLAIEQERDDIRKIELQAAREIALVRQKVREANTEGAAAEAVAAAATEERLVKLRAENAIRDVIAKRQEQEASLASRAATEAERQAERIAREQERQLELLRKQADERERAQKAASETVEDLQRQLAIVSEQDEFRRSQLQLGADLAKIERERTELAATVGEELADEVANLKAAIRETEFRTDLERELANARKQAADAERSAQSGVRATRSVASSFGGAITVANASAQRGIAIATEAQVKIQERIANLVNLIAQNTAAGSMGIA